MKEHNRVTLAKYGKDIHPKEPFLSLNSHGLAKFNTRLAEIMMIEKGDRLKVYEDEKHLYIGITKEEDGFPISVGEFGSSTITRMDFALFLKDFFKLKKKASYRLLIEEKGIDYKDTMIFKIKSAKEYKKD